LATALFFAVKLMPLQVICQKCKFVLYERKELKPPYELVEGYNGKCPNCRKKTFSNTNRL
jgi:hypothetical protein